LDCKDNENSKIFMRFAKRPSVQRFKIQRLIFYHEGHKGFSQSAQRMIKEIITNIADLKVNLES